MLFTSSVLLYLPNHAHTHTHTVTAVQFLQILIDFSQLNKQKDKSFDGLLIIIMLIINRGLSRARLLRLRQIFNSNALKINRIFFIRTSSKKLYIKKDTTTNYYCERSNYVIFQFFNLLHLILRFA